ncbi:MAG: hypothetical protein ACUVR3_10155, partial [Candidatus Roseilinea sp.]|uniref:hypothetical protein n=1 Tax=Candidatus Roseilinea sp. TaxID=2838777 RepID=UPI0040493E9F
VLAAADAQPFTCEFRKFADGTPFRQGKYLLTEADMTGAAPKWVYSNYYLKYNSASGVWQVWFLNAEGDGILNYRDTVLRLFKESPFKP